MQKERQLGLDILRIISMLLITVIHYIAYSGVEQNSNITTYNKIILAALGGLATVAVNIFVLITGYFQCEKKLNFKRIFFLWVQVLLTGYIAFLLAMLFFKQPFSLTSLIKTLLPLMTMHYWFFTMYVILMLISPFINVFLNTITTRQHKLLCLCGFLLITVMFVSNPFINSQYYLADARGVVWLIYLYIVGAAFKKMEYRISKKFAIISSVLILSVIVILKYFDVENISNSLLLNGNSILPFLLSVLLFGFFKDVSMKNSLGVTKKALTKLSSCAFLVYIVQENDMLRTWYWNLFSINQYANSPWLFLNLLLSLLALWPIALLLNFLFNLISPMVNSVYDKLSDIVIKCLSKKEER